MDFNFSDLYGFYNHDMYSFYLFTEIDSRFVYVAIECFKLTTNDF